MILIALGGNLPSPDFGTPRDTIEAALAALQAQNVEVLAQSRWYSTAPVPASDQPDFTNLVVQVRSDREPGNLMTLLHEVESRFGRVRHVRNEARVLDIDLLDHNGEVRTSWPILPHSRLAERAFVLVPLRDVAPNWRHPVTGDHVDELIDRAPDRAGITLLAPDEGP